jgi:outer membrane biosynthesis protein TonB
MRTDNFNFFLLVSLALHICLLIGIAASKNFSFLRVPPQESVVFMHVLPVSHTNNIKTRNEKQSELPEKEQAKKVEASSEAKPEEQSKPDKPAEPDKAKEEKVQEAKATIADKPKEQTKKATKTNDLDLKSLEKSLKKSTSDKNKEKPSEGAENKSNKKSGGQNQDNQTSSSDNYDSNSPESVNAKSLMKQRIEKNRQNLPILRDYPNLKIRVRLQLDINQLVQGVSDFEFLNEDVPENIKIVIKNSIINAIKASEPFDMLQLEYYDDWRDNELIFGND